MVRDWDIKAGELSAEAIADGQPTAWFDRLYSAGVAGEVSLPWDRDTPQVLLQEWVEAIGLRGAGRRAVVVGCGLGADAEYLARQGFATVGFDVAPTAVRLARERHPGTPVDYQVADLLDLPPDWHGAFDLVVEVFTVQALPDPPRQEAMRAIVDLVAVGGTLLAIEFRSAPDEPLEAGGPPYALDRAAMVELGRGLQVVHLDELEQAGGARWRAEYRR